MPKQDEQEQRGSGVRLLWDLWWNAGRPKHAIPFIAKALQREVAKYKDRRDA